jgi:hypothetical protein
MCAWKVRTSAAVRMVDLTNQARRIGSAVDEVELEPVEPLDRQRDAVYAEGEATMRGVVGSPL